MKTYEEMSKIVLARIEQERIPLWKSILSVIWKHLVTLLIIVLIVGIGFRIAEGQTDSVGVTIAYTQCTHFLAETPEQLETISDRIVVFTPARKEPAPEDTYHWTTGTAVSIGTETNESEVITVKEPYRMELGTVVTEHDVFYYPMEEGQQYLLFLKHISGSAYSVVDGDFGKYPLNTDTNWLTDLLTGKQEQYQLLHEIEIVRYEVFLEHIQKEFLDTLGEIPEG